MLNGGQAEIVIKCHQRRRVREVEQAVVGVGKLLGIVLGMDRAAQIFGNRAGQGEEERILDVFWGQNVGDGVAGAPVST